MRAIWVFISILPLFYALPYDCPSNSVPYKMSMLGDGSVHFDCAYPSCFGHDNNGRPTSWSKFYKSAPNAASYQQSDFHLLTYVCGLKNSLGNCPQGMVPDYANVSSVSQEGVCCEPQPVSYAEYWGNSVVQKNFEIAGGNIAPDVFAYISDVVAQSDESNEVKYQVHFRKLPCPRFVETTTQALPALPARPAQASAPVYFEAPRHPLAPSSGSSGSLYYPSALPSSSSSLYNPLCHFHSYRRVKRQGCPPGTTPLYCFTADMTVKTIDGAHKRMDELEIGDFVLTSNMRYSRVRGWIHKIPSENGEFIKMSLSDNNELKISHKHLIYKADCNSPSLEIPKEPVFAEQLQTGDCLFVANQNDQLSKVRITDMDIVAETGIYSPETEDGDIVVNNVVASCYSNMHQITLHRTIFDTLNGIQNSVQWLFGGSSTKSDEKELLASIPFALDIADYIVPVKMLQK